MIDIFISKTRTRIWLTTIYDFNTSGSVSKTIIICVTTITIVGMHCVFKPKIMS